MAILQKPVVIQENIVDDHLWLLNTVLGETLKEIATFLKNRNIKYDYLPAFLVNPEKYPGNKITGLRKIAEKFLQDIVSKHYFKIQAEGLPVKFVINTVRKIVFESSLDRKRYENITMATRGGVDARKAISTSRIEEPPRLLVIKKEGRKIRPKPKSKSNLLFKNKKEQIKAAIEGTSKKGRKGFCEYCGAKTKPRATGNTVHINITQKPPLHQFCSKECKAEWIYALTNNKTPKED